MSIKDIFLSIKNKTLISFDLACKGREDIKIIYGWWGIFAYAICFLVIERIIILVNFRLVDILLSMIAVFYFILHIIFIVKNLPKDPEISEEEKLKIKEELKRTRSQRALRKFLLKEPMGKWKPHLFFGAVNIYIIAHYIHYITR